LARERPESAGRGMNTPMRPSPRHVPTLTEVIDLPEAPLVQAEPGDAVVTDLPLALAAETASVAAPVPEPLVEAPAAFAAKPVVETAAEPHVRTTSAAPVAEPLNLQDAPIPRAMLVDRGLERTGFTRAVPGGYAEASTNPVPGASPVSTPAGSALGTAALEAQITQRVMVDLQRQIDGMLEYRLRETLAPILARTSEALVRELRQELSKTMKDVVARSVAQEVARQRSRNG
jgi:hypothetical protein